VTEPGDVRRVLLERWVEHRGERHATGILSYADFADIAKAPALAGAAAWTDQQLTVGHGMEARILPGLAVSAGYFDVVGVQPAVGRFLHESDYAPDAARAVVISHELWQREYGGAADVVGRTLEFGSTPATIVGVAPPGMLSLRLTAVAVWLPITSALSPEILQARNYWQTNAIVRLREGVTDAAATEQMTLLLRQGRAEQIAAGRFDSTATMITAPLLEARGPLAGAEATVAKWLLGVSLVVLLIAAVNVANLLLARAVRRSRETAVRLALGITRRRLIGQTLLEGVILGLLGGVCALLLSRWTRDALSAALLPNIAWAELGWTPRVLPLALAAACITGLISAIVPAVQSLRHAASMTLRGSGAGGLHQATGRTRTALALVQAALSVVLLIGAGLFVRSLDAARALDLGYDMRDLHYVDMRYVPGSTDEEERTGIAHAVLDRLREHPAVAAAAAASSGPFNMAISNNVKLPGRDELPVVGSGDHWYYSVSGGYFELLGMRPARGRLLNADDVRHGLRVAVVNETMARALWTDADPIGQCILPGTDTECVHVVGVVPDTRQRGIREDAAMQYYVPMSTASRPGVIMVKPRGGGAAARTHLRDAVLALDPRIRMVEVRPASELVAPQLRSWRLGAAMFTGFGALALVVAALGMYAVLAFDVSQRTREIGVRSALGAHRGHIIAMILSRALAVAAAGALLGMLVAALLAPRLTDMLFQVQPRDPLTYAVVVSTLLTAALAAALIPALRATRVDPNVALRAE
jgi:predicted permease